MAEISQLESVGKWILATVVLIISVGFPSLSTSSSASNGQIASSLLLLNSRYQSLSSPSSSLSSSSSSVHRFSNLYGTILHCRNYITSYPLAGVGVGGGSTSSNGISPASINNHHQTTLQHQHLLPLMLLDNDLNMMMEQSMLSYTNSHRNHHHQQQQQQPFPLHHQNISFEWQVRYRSSSSSKVSTTNHYQRAHDQANLRYTDHHDGSMALAPFEFDSFLPDVHDAYYRCLLKLPGGQGTITSHEIHVQAVVERLPNIKSAQPETKQQSTSAKLSRQQHQNQIQDDSPLIRVLNSTEVYEGNDAILKCEFDRRNSLYEVSAWFRDDGKIYLPLENLVHTVRRTLSGGNGAATSGIGLSSLHYVNYSSIRHFVLPNSGDLLISNVNYGDVKHRYRCQIRHMITNHRKLSQSWAHIIFKKNSDFYNSGPRLNPQLQSRHTIAVNEGESAFFYCSFDGHPTPIVEWYHTDLKTLTMDSGNGASSYSIAFSSYIAQSSNAQQEIDIGIGGLGEHSSSPRPFPISRQLTNLANGQYIYGRNFLAIERVSIEDTGIISCEANNSNSIIRHEMLLFVKNFLQVSLHSTTSLPFPGQDVTLSCNLSAIVSPFNSAFSSSNIFTADHSSKSDHQTPNNNNNNNNEHHQKRKEKRFRELISSHFMLNINWYHNGQSIDFDHRKRRSAEELLLIKDFRGPEDNGIYQCSIRLTAPDYDEESLMSAIYLNVMEKVPEFIDVFPDQIKQIDGPKRDYLSLKCSSYGIPLPRISWFLDGQELYSNGHVRIETFTESYTAANFNPSTQNSPSSLSSAASAATRSLIVSYLNISSLHSKDIGIYECVAENYLGTIIHRARINQIGSPFIKMIQNQTAVLGQSYTMNCTYGGYPLEEVYFIKGKHSGSSSSGYQQTGKSSGSTTTTTNKRMPFDERHLVPMLGSITITIVEKSDQDYYRCVVVTSNGQKAEQEFYLHVAVAPVISPIVFSDNFEEGKRGSAVCTVTSGDPPIQISWFKDGVPLEPSLLAMAGQTIHHAGQQSGSGRLKSFANHLNQIQIAPINEFMSSLIISNISRHHQGTYTCMASSPVATTNVSAFLSVKAAPVWLLKPADRNSVSGEPLILDCQTSGQPPPVIRWKFLKNEPYRSEPMPILSSQQVHVLENGSLYLRALEPKHSGIYICDTSNEVSKHPIESRAYVTVTSLPKVSIQNTLGNSVSSPLISKGPNSLYRAYNLDRLILRKGAQTQLMCSVVGLEQPMNAEWLRPSGESGEEPSEKTKNGNKMYHDSSRIVLREESKMNEKRAYLYISHVNRMDTGVYCCLGSNANGYSVSFIELVVQEPPDMPVQFRTQEIGSRSVSLTWSIEFGGNSPITSYVVEYRQLHHNNNNQHQLKSQQQQDSASNTPEANIQQENKILTAKSLATSITINGLNPLSTYEFRVCAINELGASPFSDPLLITTEMEAPSLIPLDLRTLVLGSRSIKLIWSIVLTVEPPIEQIDGFYIGYRPILASSSAPSSSSTSGTSSSSSSVGSSIDQTQSMMMMMAVDQSSNNGGDSITNNNNNNNNNNKPVIISNPNNNNNNGPGTTIINNNNNGKMIPYTFKTMYDDHSKIVLTMALNGSMSSTLSSNNNNNGHNNSNGIPKTASNNMTTFCEMIRRGHPDPEHSSGKKLSNKFPSRGMIGQQQYGSRIKSNKLQSDQIRCVYEFVVSSLQRKTRYGFIIQAFNSKGAGPISSEVYAQTLLKDPPGKPIIKLTNVSLYEASFTWTIPNNQLEISNEIINDDFDIDPLDQINIEGFIISYRPLIKRLALYNNDEYDPSSENMNNNEDDQQQQQLEQQEQQRLFGRKYQANNWETISVSEKLQSHTLRNLRCGTLYQIRVEAFNEMGSGEPSDILQFSTLGQAPTVPNSNTFIISNITSVMLDLDRWNNGLCPIINFALRYRLKIDPKMEEQQHHQNHHQSNNNWITVSSHLKPEFGAMYVIRDLIPGNWYELSIIATNDAGETESRYLFSTLTLDGATVEPLYASDYNRRHLGVIGNGGQSDSIFEDPMILIPATCAILVLLVIGAATVFIFITRSKEALSRTEHFCRHRENSRSDQLSLNLFAKNYSKSDLIRTYNSADITDPHKLTHIETLNCGQTTEIINGGIGVGIGGVGVVTSQYVEGPTSLSYSANDVDPSSLPPIIDNTTPTRRIKSNVINNNGVNNGKQSASESFYSTPCIPTQSSNHLPSQIQSTFCAQTLGKAATTTSTVKHNNKHSSNAENFHPESIYGDLTTTTANLGAQLIQNPIPIQLQEQSQQQQSQHSYYTHSQFLNPGPVMNNSSASSSTEGNSNSSQFPKKKGQDKDHIYELPKQQQAKQQLDSQQQQQQQPNSLNTFDQTDANFVMLVMQQQQQQSSMGTINRNQTLQSPHRIRAELNNFRSFHQPNF